jgi:hypothetical protein
MIEWNYIKNKENEDHKLQEELDLIAEEIQELFDELGFEDIGKGAKKPDFDVRWQNIQYPIKGSEEVELNDEISFDIRIKSSYLAKKKFDYLLTVIDSNKSVVTTIAEDTIVIQPNEVFVHSFGLDISEDNARRYSENRILLKVSVQGSGKTKVKELPFYFDMQKPDNIRENVILTMNSCTFPREGSRRINFDETLRDISYRVDNKRPYDLKYRLNISIHDARDVSCQKIFDVDSFDRSVGPYEEMVIDIPDIEFPESEYSKFMEKGEIELRARVVAMEDSGDYEKGDRITRYKLRMFLNCDEKSGKKDAFKISILEAPDEERRSWLDANGSVKTICLNTAHIAYMFAAEWPEVQRSYLKEQMLKQYVFLYLYEQKFDTFDVNGKKIEDMDINESVDAISRKIESVLTASFV